MAEKAERLINPIKRKSDKKVLFINGKNQITAAQIKRDILESDLCHLYVKMGLTGKYITLDDDGQEVKKFVDEEGNEVKASSKGARQVIEYLEQPERMKVMKTLVDKVMPASKEEAVDESNSDKWLALSEIITDTNAAIQYEEAHE